MKLHLHDFFFDDNVDHLSHSSSWLCYLFFYHGECSIRQHSFLWLHLSCHFEQQYSASKSPEEWTKQTEYIHISQNESAGTKDKSHETQNNTKNVGKKQYCIICISKTWNFCDYDYDNWCIFTTELSLVPKLWWHRYYAKLCAVTILIMIWCFKIPPGMDEKNVIKQMKIIWYQKQQNMINISWKSKYMICTNEKLNMWHVILKVWLCRQITIHFNKVPKSTWHHIHFFDNDCKWQSSINKMRAFELLHILGNILAHLI